jgi:hypothetical protein
MSLVLVPDTAEGIPRADESLSDPISDPGSFSSDDVPPDPAPRPPSRRAPQRRVSKHRTSAVKLPEKVNETKGPRQRKIFDFVKSVGDEVEESDVFYETVMEIYRFFNRKKKIPVILTALHQSGGNVKAAVALLTGKGYGDGLVIDFRYTAIDADPDDIERYFKT